MKNVAFAAVTAFAVGAAAAAHAANERSAYGAARAAYSGEIPDMASGTTTSGIGSLNALFAEWDRTGFSAPSKPGQYRVYRRNGYVTSGPGYNALASLIRAAVNDTRKGHDCDAARKIAEVKTLLAASHSGEE